MNKNYTGRCHCGKIRFSFVSDEITEGRRCNCSLCIRRGAVMSPKYISATDFQPHKNPEDMSGYQYFRWPLDADSRQSRFLSWRAQVSASVLKQIYWR